MFQLICVLYFDVNTYGSLVAYPISLTLRLGGGEPLLNMQPFIAYPGNNFPKYSNFPFKTFTMLLTLVIIISVSYATKYLFEKEILPARYDVFGCKLTENGRSLKLKERSSHKNLMVDDDL